ncbi:hypothetical protein GGF50DRAFT_116422 [Schizophyllum commune]
MSTGAGSANQDTDRKVLYTIHYTPTKDSLPKIPRKPWRLACLELPVRGRNRGLHAKLSVGGHTQRCDLSEEAEFQFIVERGSDLTIEVCADRKAGPDCIARKTCKLASLISADDHVQLDVVDARVDAAPTLSLKVTVTSFDRNIGEDVNELSKSLALSEKWLALGDYARRIVKIGGIVAEAHPVAKAIFSFLELGVDDIEKRKEYHDDILSLVADMANSCDVVLESDTQQYAARRENQVNACNALVPEIFRALSFIRALVSKNTVCRLRSKINEEVEKLRKGLNEIADAVECARHIDTQNTLFRVEDIVTKIDIDNTLGHLQTAKGVEAASTKACLPDTRVMLLETIMNWVFDPDGFRCFCLYGTAGQGKSAVAHSVARQLAEMGVAAPFFAFDRNNRERVASQLLPTVARKLAYVDQHQLEQLRKLRADQLETMDIPDQCERLLLSCLRDYLVLTPIVIIIDALDECPNDNLDDQRDRDALLKALRTCLLDSGLHDNVRVLITTRLDPDIERALVKDCSMTQSTRLYSIETTVETEADIRKFVALKLKATKDAACYVDIVTEAAQTHFECAAVLCRELANGGRPMSCDARNRLITGIKSQPGRSLYGTYQLILEMHLNVTDAGCLFVYRQLLSWVLAVRQPQSRAVFEEISTLLLPNEDVMGVLEGLGSLLTGTVAGSEEPVRPLHTSFRDFVLDAEASEVFAITSEFDTADSQLVHACFCIMGRPEGGLRYNICNLPSPFVYKEDVTNLDDCMDKHISPGLRYACREVSAHLSHCHDHHEAASLPSDLKGFLNHHFLFWLEACGWLGHEPCDVLQAMLEWAKIYESKKSAPIVSDFISFAKRYREAISTSPPQVYLTGLLFAPVDSHVSRLYRFCITSPIQVSGYEREREWPPNETLVIQAGDRVQALAYSPKGIKILAGLDDGTLRLWDAETGRQVGGVMRDHDGGVSSVAFSPDGCMIASGSKHTVRLWDAKTGQQQGEALRGHTGWVRSVAFSPDSATVVSGSDDWTLRFWDAKTGKEMCGAMEGHTRGVDSVVFSHGGALIVSGSDDGTVRIWEAATQQQLGDCLLGHEGHVCSVAISRDDKYVASGSHDRTIRVWDTDKRQLLSTLQGHAGWVYAIAFSPDSTRIASVGRDDTVRIWDVASGKQVGDALGGHADHVRSVAFSPDGKRVASGSDDRTIRIWDVQEVNKNGGTPVGHTNAITSVACSSNGKYIISGSEDRTVRLWDAHTGQPVGDAMTGHAGIVKCVTFSPDSTRIASASEDGTVRVWDVATRLPVGDVLQASDSWVLCVAFSPDGTRLVSGSTAKTLRLWDLATGQQIGNAFCGHEGWIQSVSFSGDGLCIASGSDDYSIRIWEAQTQLQRGPPLTCHEHYVRSVAFSPNNACVVSGSADSTLRRWDITTGRQMGVSFTGHVNAVRSVAFSPNGKYIVSGSDDQTVRVWNVKTAKQVGDTLRGHENGLRSVAFSFDGTRIVSCGDDHTIRIWDCESLQRWEGSTDDAGADLTRSRVQASTRTDYWGSWLVHDDGEHGNGTDRPILWIPHHLRHLPQVISPYQIGLVPPEPHIRVTLTDSFRLDDWPIYTPAPAVKESSENMGPEA